MTGKKNLLVGLACGVLCAVCVAAYGQGVRTDANAQQQEILERFGDEQVEVYVATRDILVGEHIGPLNCELQTWPSALVAQGAVLDLDSVEDSVAWPIFAGQVITEGHFKGGSELAVQVPEGLCAVSVSAKEVSAVGGGVKSGSYVDVYASSDLGTDLLACDVLVLSTSVDADSEDLSWITLALTSDQVRDVIAASQVSTLYFSLPSEEARGLAQKTGMFEEESAVLIGGVQDETSGADEPGETSGADEPGETSGANAGEVDSGKRVGVNVAEEEEGLKK